MVLRRLLLPDSLELLYGVRVVLRLLRLLYRPHVRRALPGRDIVGISKVVTCRRRERVAYTGYRLRLTRGL